MKNKMFLDSSLSLILENKYNLVEKKKGNIVTKYFNVDLSNYKILKQKVGEYYTINYNFNYLEKYPTKIINELASVLNTTLKPYKQNGKTLIIGLGNSSVIGDSLGPKTIKKIIPTNHYDDFLTIPKLALFTPEVIGKTGISSYNLIKMVAANLKPDTIIIIDSIATTNKDHLNSSIEVNNVGVIHGNAINTNKIISEKTFGIPIISIGVPLIIDIQRKLYSSFDIENIVDITSDIIAKTINKIFLK